MWETPEVHGQTSYIASRGFPLKVTTGRPRPSVLREPCCFPLKLTTISYWNCQIVLSINYDHNQLWNIQWFIFNVLQFMKKNVKHTLSVQGRKPMRWEFFMGYRCDSPNTCVVMWTYPKSALIPISCVQTVAYSMKKKKKPWECKNLMQVWVWHLQRAETILYSWNRKSKKKNGPFRQLQSH
jgi:hypothetical protein